MSKQIKSKPMTSTMTMLFIRKRNWRHKITWSYRKTRWQPSENVSNYLGFFDNIINILIKLITCSRADNLWLAELTWRFTRSSAVAERPRDALCHWIYWWVTQDHSRSFEMTLLSRACVSPYYHFTETIYRSWDTASKNGVTLKLG